MYLSTAVLFLGAMSCKKCQTCTTEVSQDVMGVSQVLSSTSEEYCGDNYDDAPAETTVTQSVQGVEQTVSITCTDN